MTIDVMIDLEALAKHNGVITEIGAVAFCPDSGEIYKRFHNHILISSSLAAGLTIDSGTLLWWLHPAQEEARQQMLIAQEMPETLGIRAVLMSFAEWLKTEAEGYRHIWCQGMSYDFPLLSNAYHRVLLQEQPWDFRKEMCSRELFTLNATRLSVELEAMGGRKGTHHNALHDAENQARAVAKVLFRASGKEPVL